MSSTSNPNPSTSRKRKAATSGLPLQRKRSPNAISVAPMSAFAAARAKIQSRNQEPVVPDAETEGRSESIPKILPRSVDAARHQLEKELSDQVQLARRQHPGPSEPDEYWDPSLDYQSDESTGKIRVESIQESSVSEPRTPLSTWKGPSSNVISRSSTSERLRMTHGQTLAILGQYRLKVHEGLASISGAILTPLSAEQEICTTRLSALPPIKCISSGGAEIEAFHLPRSQKTLQNLERLSPLFSNILPQISDKSSFIKILDSDEEMQSTLLPLEIPSAWQQTINRLCDGSQSHPMTVQICGPANAGKSTFTRLLTNSWLSSASVDKRKSAVAILDLDPNKPEHSPPGQITLFVVQAPILSPSFAHPRTIGGQKLVRSHAIGLDGSRENTAHYLDAAQDLLQCYRSLNGEGSLDLATSDIPLIITCPAWYQGSGMDLNVRLTRALVPSHVVCLGEGPTKVMAALQRAAGATPLQILQSQPYLTAGATRTPSELREMQLISYFHSELHSNGNLLWNASPLTSQKPYQVSYSEERSEFAGIFIFGEVPVMYPNMLSALLNGSLVSLIAVENDEVLDTMEIYRGEGDEIPYFAAGLKGYTAPFDPKTASVIGVGLIRSIDTEEQSMQILTPIPPQALAKVPHKSLVLAFGALECPGWAYTEDFNYHDWATNGRQKGLGKELKSAPWVEEVGEEVRQVSGPAMQAWKSRRFQ